MNLTVLFLSLNIIPQSATQIRGVWPCLLCPAAQPSHPLGKRFRDWSCSSGVPLASLLLRCTMSRSTTSWSPRGHLPSVRTPTRGLWCKDFLSTRFGIRLGWHKQPHCFSRVPSPGSLGMPQILRQGGDMGSEEQPSCWGEALMGETTAPSSSSPL